MVSEIPSPEKKQSAEDKLHGVLTEAYDRLLDEFKTTPRYRELVEQDITESFAANLKNRFRAIGITADPDIAAIELGLKPQPKRYPKGKPYILMSPLRGASEIKSNARIEDASKPLTVGSYAAPIERAEKSGDFMALTVRLPDAQAGFGPSFVYDEPALSRSGKVFTSPHMPPFFVPDIDLMQLIGVNDGSHSTPSLYLELMQQSGLPLQTLTQEECEAIADFVGNAHGVSL